jgi:hypothetical protein
MSRIIFTATAMAGILLASLGSSPAKAQFIDLRIPPLGGARSTGLDAFHIQNRAIQPGFGRSHTLHPTSANRHLPNIHGRGHGHGGGFSHQVPGGFPTGGFPTNPGFGGHGHGHGHGQGHGHGHGGSCTQSCCSPGFGSPAIGVADQLIAQTAAFLRVFGPTAHIVPQGNRIYGDAESLYRSAVTFRQAAIAGAPHHELRRLQSRVESDGRRLVNRVNGVAGWRNGPNIQQVRFIGDLARQLRAFV